MLKIFLEKLVGAIFQPASSVMESEDRWTLAGTREYPHSAH